MKICGPLVELHLLESFLLVQRLFSFQHNNDFVNSSPASRSLQN